MIAGATGSGKSVCINTLIMSILYKAKPDEVKLIMIDPKVVELSVYNGVPHLLIPVVTDPKKAAGALNWAVSSMTERYNTFAEYNVRNLEEYNKKIEDAPGNQRGGTAEAFAADCNYRGRAGRFDDGGPRRGGGRDLPSGSAGTCSGNPSDYCHTKAICECHHRLIKANMRRESLFLSPLGWTPGRFWT